MDTSIKSGPYHNVGTYVRVKYGGKAKSIGQNARGGDGYDESDVSFD
jgi:erythromycin esterase-like protein